MPRRQRAKSVPSVVPGPRLACEAARGAADFETHIVDAGGHFEAVAIVFHSNVERITGEMRSVSAALMAARCSDWWRLANGQSIEVEVRAVLGKQVWRLNLDGCWDLAQGHEKGRAA